jgi:hypothetical protein
MKDTPLQTPPPDGSKPDKPTRVGLQEIIQMECQERNSSILEIYNEDEQGRIFIENGKIIHAVINQLKGERALAKLLDLPGGSFEVVPFQPPEERTLAASWTSLLQQKARTSDEPAAPAVAVATGAGAAGGSAGGAAGGLAARVAETFICSPTGEILYQAQCADAAGRTAWLQSVAEQADQLGKTLPLGQFDRMDIAFANTRIVSRFRADSLVYLRTVRDTGSA